LGIGSGVSTDLITESANAGKGRHFFVNDNAEGLKKCVIECLESAMLPSLNIKKMMIELNKPILIQTDPNRNALRNGDIYSYFAIIDGVDVEGRIKTVFTNSKTHDVTSVSY